jgi:hypothetical protein
MSLLILKIVVHQFAQLIRLLELVRSITLDKNLQDYCVKSIEMISSCGKVFQNINAAEENAILKNDPRS